jgi:Arc/MetJ family transcription regulator
LLTAASLRAHPVTEQRPYVDEALRHLEKSRHRVLLAIFAVALEDGMTISP